MVKPSVVDEQTKAAISRGNFNRGVKKQAVLLDLTHGLWLWISINGLRVLSNHLVAFESDYDEVQVEMVAVALLLNPNALRFN